MRSQAIDLSGDSPKLRLAPWERIDPGSYRLSAATTHATLAATASAMGDTELCNAMLDLIEREHQPVMRNGAARLPRPSVLTNLAYICARLHRTESAPAPAGPQLAHVDFPDVLVVRAVNQDGALHMSLQPGDGPVPSTPLKFARLDPLRRYRLDTGNTDVELVADHNGEAIARIALAARSRITLRQI